MPRKSRKVESPETPRKIRPALSEDAREQQLISLAVDCAERQMMDGTASSAVIVHYLKLGTAREKLEMKRLEKEIAYQEAKTQAIKSGDEMKEMYKNAIDAMRRYSGYDDEEEYDDDY